MHAPRCSSLVEIRPGKICAACWVWSVVTALALGSLAGASPPNPVALLRGAEQARLAVRTGDVEIAVVIERWLPLPQKDNLHLHATFDGEKLTIRRRDRALVIDDSDGQGEARYKQLLAMNNDREAFVRAGLGRWEERVIYSAWDGTNLCQQSYSGSASYLDHTKGNSELVFHPRLLGLDPYYQPGHTVSHFLRFDDESKVTLVAGEVINEISTWHVLVKPYPDVVIHYWIEDREGFRVHRCRLEDLSGFRVLDSYYDERSPGPIPSRVIDREYRKDGKVWRETRFEVTKAQFNKPGNPYVGTLASLDLKPGDEVSDERIGKRLGYWDGQGVTEDYTRAVQLGQARVSGETGEEGQPRWLYPLLAALGLIVLSGVIYAVAARIRRTPASR